MARMARFVKPIIDTPAPKPTSVRPTDLLYMKRLVEPFKKLSPRDMHLFVKMMTMSSVDFLDEWFESEVLKSPMAVSGIIGTMADACQ